MERNVKVYRAHRAISWLYLLCFSLFAVMFIAVPDMPLTSIAFPLLMFIILFLAHHLTAKGAMQSKPWSRVSSIVISLILLVGFPIGTVIGVYLLFNTWRPWDEPPPAVPAVT